MDKKGPRDDPGSAARATMDFVVGQERSVVWLCW